jgi:uncharacterized membrane protein YdbT with pleckstrin-like domain
MELAEGENILYEGHPSWRSILAFYAKAVAIALVAAVIAYFASGSTVGWGVVVLLVFLAGMVLIGLVMRIAVTYRVTDQRLNIKRGILSRRVQETRLTRVQNVNTNQGPLERLLRVGAVDFDTAGSDDYDFTFRGVADPEGIAHQVDQAIRAMPIHG